MDFKTLLKNEFVFLDGGMGTLLHANGLKTGEIPEELNIKNPELITKIHKSYVDAGSNIIYANTFGANSFKLEKSDYTLDEVIKSAIANARKAVEGTDTLIALDIGPLGRLIEPLGTLTFEESYNAFKEIVDAGKEADLFVIETMTDLYELKSALLAVKENSNKPVLCTMSFESNLRTFNGCSIESMALTLEGLGADAIGVNCSLGPKELIPIIEKLAKFTFLPIIAKPNAGLPDPITNQYNISADLFADYILELSKLGVKIFGGCCGTTPLFIAKTIEKLKDVKYKKPDFKRISAVCSGQDAVIIDGPKIIGERINPTGKKLLKEALRNGDIGYILGKAIEQVEAGAEILDVNVGLPEIDEKEMMIKAVKELQGITSVPLQIDSTKPEVIESALRIYNGKALVNSVSGEKSSMEKILPLVKKYGASVVGLTLDENGIPKTAEGRFNIAKRIIENAEKLGINKEDVFIDCLTLTASAEQEGAGETLKALNRVKTELGAKTVLGVSNISFGLPDRENINRTFLSMALEEGLDLPIINPNIDSMTGAVRAYRLLKNIDKDCIDYIAAYSEKETDDKKPTSKESNLGLFDAVLKGLKEESAKITKDLLKEKEPLQIVDEYLIPALDKVGKDFEKGTLFLPQLMQSATASQSAFEILKEEIVKSGGGNVSKGKIVLATVKGDIHDIGKNIVKVILENYGYTVIDLGRDVPPEEILKAVKENDIKLVGLSALMTTTLQSMEDTINLLKANHMDCKVMVGGAVLTPEYAKNIGADFYAKDAVASANFAGEIFKQ